MQPKHKSTPSPGRERDSVAAPPESATAPRVSHAAQRESAAPRESTQGPRDATPSLRESLAPRESSAAPRGGGEPRRTSMPPPRSSVPAAREGSGRPESGGARRLRLDEPMVLDNEPGAFLFGSWKNVFVGVWESQATMPAVERMVRATNILSDLHPEGRSTIHIVANGAGLPTADVRASFVDALKKNAGQLACVAVVVGGTGFWTSALRSFVTGLRWLAPRSFEFRMNSSLQQVGMWLPAEHGRRTGVDLDPRRLVQVLDTWAAPRRQGR